MKTVARNGRPLEARTRKGGVHADQRPSSRKRRRDIKLALRNRHKEDA